MSYKEIISRSILQRASYIEPDFWSAYYLDAYEMPRSFSLDLITLSKPLKIKTNAVKLLQRKLAQKHRPLRDVVTIGSRGEPYGKAEEHYKLTQGFLESLARYRYPVHLITSSDLVLRDIELLRSIADKSFLHISVPVLFCHELYERFYGNELQDSCSLISALRDLLPEVHISAVVTSILPCMGDDKEALSSMTASLKKVRASSVHFSLIEDLSSKQTQILLDMLGDYPEIIDSLVENFDFLVEEGVIEEGAMTIDAKKREKFTSLTDKIISGHKLTKETPRYLPADYRYSNYLLSQRLFKRAYDRERTGSDGQIIREIAHSIQALDHTARESVLREFAKEPSLSRDIDYFLFSGELKNFGQASLF